MVTIYIPRIRRKKTSDIATLARILHLIRVKGKENEKTKNEGRKKMERPNTISLILAALAGIFMGLAIVSSSWGGVVDHYCDSKVMQLEVPVEVPKNIFTNPGWRRVLPVTSTICAIFYGYDERYIVIYNLEKRCPCVEAFVDTELNKAWCYDDNISVSEETSVEFVKEWYMPDPDKIIKH